MYCADLISANSIRHPESSTNENSTSLNSWKNSIISLASNTQPALKNILGLPMGTDRKKFPFLEITRFVSANAFQLPLKSRGSPYLPNPMCSITCKQESDWILLSANGRRKIFPEILYKEDTLIAGGRNSI